MVCEVPSAVRLTGAVLLLCHRMIAKKRTKTDEIVHRALRFCDGAVALGTVIEFCSFSTAGSFLSHARGDTGCKNCFTMLPSWSCSE